MGEQLDGLDIGVGVHDPAGAAVRVECLAEDPEPALIRGRAVVVEDALQVEFAGVEVDDDVDAAARGHVDRLVDRDRAVACLHAVAPRGERERGRRVRSTARHLVQPNLAERGGFFAQRFGGPLSPSLVTPSRRVQPSKNM